MHAIDAVQKSNITVYSYYRNCY